MKQYTNLKDDGNHFLSTTHTNQLKKTIRRENRERVGATVITAADYYTKEGMGAVDCFNKKLSDFDFHRRHNSWRSANFFTMLIGSARRIR